MPTTRFQFGCRDVRKNLYQVHKSSRFSCDELYVRKRVREFRKSWMGQGRFQGGGNHSTEP